MKKKLNFVFIIGLLITGWLVGGVFLSMYDLEQQYGDNQIPHVLHDKLFKDTIWILLLGVVSTIGFDFTFEPRSKKI